MIRPHFLDAISAAWDRKRARRAFTPAMSFEFVAGGDDESALAMRALIIQRLLEFLGEKGWGFATRRNLLTDDRVIRFDFCDATAGVYFALCFASDRRITQVTPAPLAYSIS
jgi:hypothetical protein